MLRMSAVLSVALLPLAVQPLSAQEPEPAPATIIGRAVDAHTMRPVPGVAIRIEGDDGADRVQVTDAAGRFTFAEVRPGKRLFAAERLGYGRTADSLHVPEGKTIEVVFRIASTPLRLEPLTITVVRSEYLELIGFYQRRKTGIGSFLTRREIREMHPLRLSDVLRTVAGVRIVRRGFARLPVGRGRCPFAVYIDHVRVRNLFDINSFPPRNFAGIEIYAGPAETPVRYSRDNICGVILLWTRRGG